MKRQELIDYYQQENESFSFDNFFTNDDKDPDKRGIIVITPNQTIKARTPILTDTKKRADHEPTYNNLTCTLYNIGFDKNDNLIEYHNLPKDYIGYIDYLQYNQNIVIMMCNIGVKHSKLVVVHIPPLISSAQLKQLEKLEDEQGLLLKKVSKEISDKCEDPLVMFIDSNNKIIKGDSLNVAINYVKDNNLVSDIIPRLDEDIIYSKTDNSKKIDRGLNE